MLEVLMGLSLAIMGIYFIKSTDLPKDLKDRSAQLRTQSDYREMPQTNKIIFPKIEIKDSVTIEQKRLEQKKLQQKEEITKLIVAISALDQELKTTVERTNEIRKMINDNKSSLDKLQARTIA